MSKNIVTSKTFWFGVALEILGAFIHFRGDLEPYFGEWGGMAFSVAGILVQVLRLVTTKPVHVVAPKG